MPGPGYKVTPPPRTDQIEDQLVLNIVSRGQSSLDGKYYTYVHGIIIDNGEVSEIEISASMASPAALGEAIESLIEKMKQR